MNRFHCHRVPDSFQLKVFGFVEVRRGPLDCPELHWFVRYRACFLGGWDSGDFPGLCKKTPARNHPLVWYGTTWDSRRAYLSFFCRYRFELALLRVFVGRWKLLVDDGLWWVGSDSSMLVCRDQLRPSFRPWVTVTGKSPTSPSEMDDLHFIISSMFWLGVHGQVGIHGPLSGLDFPVRGISLRRSVHDAGFVCGCDRWGPLCFFEWWTLFLSGVSCMTRFTLWR